MPLYNTLQEDLASSGTFLYRYEVHHPYYQRDGSEPDLKLHKFKIIKRTKHGYWIDNSGYGSSKRWVADSGMKRYAYPSIAQARISVIKRTAKHLFLLKSRIKTAIKTLEASLKDASELAFYIYIAKHNITDPEDFRFIDVHLCERTNTCPLLANRDCTTCTGFIGVNLTSDIREAIMYEKVPDTFAVTPVTSDIPNMKNIDMCDLIAY